jgi:2-iminobutanoate/2-iminopropanoate deaminase
LTGPISQFFEVYPDLPNATMPFGICVDGLVYANGLSGTDPATGRPADGLVAQTELALRHLKALVEGAGGTIDNIGRAVAYVSAIEDRDAVYGPWDAMFPNPEERPAFKVVVGPLPPDHLVQIDGLAILGKRRTRTEIDGVPARDPTVRIGDWIFTSRVHGIVPHGHVPENPEAEALQNFRNLAALLEINGYSPKDLAQVTLFGSDASHFDLAQRAYELVFPDPTARPGMQRLVSYVVPRFRVSVEMIAVKGHAVPQAAFREIYLCPERSPISSGARLGPLVYADGLPGADPCDLMLPGDGTEGQLRTALANLDRFLAASGIGDDHLARATFYMSEVDDRSQLNAAWAGRFADEATRPPHKYAPAVLAKGHRVRLQVLAVPGGTRRTLDIPGLKHGDPMAMGAQTGNLVTSSRLFGTHAFTGARAGTPEESASLAFAHAGTLLQRAEANWLDVAQVTAFVGDASYRAIVERELAAVAGRNPVPPRLNVVVSSWAGASAPRIEILALRK